jgi:metal-responsive CopG/Arc/MetJ family transcriptional regulator
MANVKTAISIDKSLFDEVNRLADELEVSRSGLFVLAVEEFIQRRENRQILQQLNRAYDDLPDAEEVQIQQNMRRYQRRLVEGEW